MNKLLFVFLSIFSLTAIAQEKDVFGIEHLMPSKLPKVEWNSQHWSTGGQRSLGQDQPDPLDPTGWSRPRGDLDLFTINGSGVLRMGGNQPRIYIQSTNQNPVFFRDTEFTGYFKRVGTDGPFNGGMVIGVRSGVNGHGRDNCDATTYYFGVRYPGSWVFYKELTHPLGANGSSGRVFPNNEPMPTDKWIGVKFLTYNIPGTDKVKLEGYVDLESGGDPSKEVTWTKVAEIIDEGNWTVPVGDCGYPGNRVITRGGGTVLIRNSGTQEAQYKNVSVREIDPEGTVNPPPTEGEVTLYTDCPFSGTTQGFAAGRYNLSDLEAAGIQNDQVSSVKVNTGYKATLYWDQNFEGRTLEITADNSCLVDEGWDNALSSMVVSKVGDGNNPENTKQIEAENYTSSNDVQKEACSEGGENVGYINEGSWMAYADINFPATGQYKIEYRVASPNSGRRFSSDLNSGSIRLGIVDVPNTGGWQNWQTVSQTVTVDAGTYQFGIWAMTEGWNINWIKITPQGSQARTARRRNTTDFTVYPNPTSDVLQFSDQVDWVELTDINGRTSTYDNVSTSIDVATLPNGVYLVKGYRNNGKDVIFQRKVTIQR